MRDIRIIPDIDGAVTFDLYDAVEDSAVALLQRLYVLLFSEADASYRESTGASLLKFLEGGNMPPDAAMNSILGIACAGALNSLDSSDRYNVESFTGTCQDSEITCTLRLKDGTLIRGLLTHG